MPFETWKPVIGFEGSYEVSDRGRVRSLPREWTQLGRPSKGGQERVPHVHRRAGQLLRPGLTAQGYPSVVLGRGNTRLVHRLVLEAFAGPPLPGQEVLHGDGSRDNNRLENLRWGTRSENVQDSIRHGTHWSGLRKEKR